MQKQFKLNTMKNTFFLLVAVLVLCSCEKVIKIDLNKDNQSIVIEATVNADSLAHQIRITKTINFDEDISAPIVNDATVTLIDKNTQDTVACTYLKDGYYQSKDLKGVVGHTYELIVVLKNGEIHKATSTIPNRIKLDSLYIVKYPFGPNIQYSIIPYRKDIANERNWSLYQLRKAPALVKLEVVKGLYGSLYQLRKEIYLGKLEVVKGLFVDDDNGLDGTWTKKPIFDNGAFSPDTIVEKTIDGKIIKVPKFKIKKNGKVIAVADSILGEVTLCNIENKIYRYFLTLTLNGGGRQTATPSNPDALFSNNAIGYFSAQAIDRKTIWIK